MSESVEIEIAELPELKENAGNKLFEKLNPKILKGIEVEAKVEIGRSTISVEKLMSLASGSILEFDTPSAQELSLLVGGEVVAKGRLVIVKGYYGLQISEVFQS
ncbi:FliM/FliN family flagellar motor switch protein [Microbulbifer rhizosphaerae]|uniref:Flagellar motor switch protein FliN n=1 Tax=Microbulbifer rhizosphaerae TaxID=1562603 RepID=A0A7W4WFW6_9GAMM|nr:FliM/FliN family flagellar motor C-terminal domain-containing protein [Microbulbifer rhizosphaerae]MBB3063500.1 flagellar motor switch protein FliN [Microbulbifer rhizosphaerae]